MPSTSGDDSFTTIIALWRDQSLWRISTTRTVEGLSDQPKCGVKQQYEAPVKKHAVEYIKLVEEYEEVEAQGSGKYEEYEAKEKGWKGTIEEILSLMKELTGRTSEEKVKENLEEGQKKFHDLKEVGRRSMRKQRNKVSLSLSHWVSKGRLKNYRGLLEQSCSESLRSKKGEREEKIKKKKARRTEKENERTMRTDNGGRKRSRSKGRCEVNEEKEGNKN